MFGPFSSMGMRTGSTPAAACSAPTCPAFTTRSRTAGAAAGWGRGQIRCGPTPLRDPRGLRLSGGLATSQAWSQHRRRPVASAEWWAPWRWSACTRRSPSGCSRASTQTQDAVDRSRATFLPVVCAGPPSTGRSRRRRPRFSPSAGIQLRHHSAVSEVPPAWEPWRACSPCWA